MASLACNRQKPAIGALFSLCYSEVSRAMFFPFRFLSGRSAAWLARLVRDQEVEGSNPFAPTTFFLPSHILTRLRCNRVRRDL